MLNSIRTLINEKTSFVDEATPIYEDGLGNLDDSIVLGEESNNFNEEDETGIDDGGDMGGDIPVTEEPEPEVPNEGGEEETPVTSDPSDDPLDAPVDGPEPDTPGSTTDEPTNTEIPMNDNEPDDILDTPVDPVGSSEMPSDDEQYDNILDTTVDLRSNTVNDTLPIPPANASEALPSDDILSQKVDSGFGDDDELPSEPVPVTPEPAPSEDPLDTPVEPGTESGEDDLADFGEKTNILVTANKLKGYHIEDIPYIIYSTACKNKNKKPVSEEEFNSNVKFKPMKAKVYEGLANFINKPGSFTLVQESVENELQSILEGITLGGEDEAAPVEDPGSMEEVPDGAAPDEENDVTSAVRDKVSEADGDGSEEAIPEDIGDISADSGESKQTKEMLGQKLVNASKALEDAKLALMKSM